MSATQPSETILQLVQNCFRQLVGIVARYEGIISGFRGDGLLALFGAPILHENDAERAIRAAMDMRNVMHDRQLEVTIGINTAPMTVGEIQTQLHREYTAYGTDVILASRLQDAAQPGQILAGTGTHRLTRRAFDFEIVHDIELQGFPQPVTAYVVQQVKVHPEKLRGIEGLRARMIGREHEFAELKEAADLWLNGQGQMVSIIGEAGIGKSRLVAELKEYLRERVSEKTRKWESEKVSGEFVSILEGRCVSIGQPISYWQLSSQAQRKCLERYTEVPLQRLRDAESRRLVQELLTIEDLPDSVRGMILRKSEGNPFFIEEVIRSLIERGLVYHEDDRWKAKEGIAELEVPDTIQSVILARVDRLESEAKYVLQCASVIGRLFKHRLLEHLTQKQRELDRYIAEFEDRDLVYEERTIPELEYAFKHALTQAATYQGILEQRRRVFHRIVAQGIERLYQERSDWGDDLSDICYYSGRKCCQI